MTAPIKQSSFSGGEISPLLYGRADNVKYETGLRTMRNFMSMRHGGATQRPGTQYIGTALNNGNAVRLVKFVFNETGIGQSFVLEFGAQYIAFYQNGGVVVSGGNPYTIFSPYLQEDLFDLQFQQTNDIITIVHQNYQMRELRRNSQTDWILSSIVLGATIGAPTAISAVGGNGALTKQNYVVTAFSSNGEESLISNVVLASVGGADESNGVSVTWTAPTGGTVSSYRVYKSSGTAADAYGYIATVTAGAFVDFGVTPDFSNSPPIFFDPFNSSSTPRILSVSSQFQTPASPYGYVYGVVALVNGVIHSPVLIYSSSTAAPSLSNIYSFSWEAVPGANFYYIGRNNADGNPPGQSQYYGPVAPTTFSDNGSITFNVEADQSASNNPKTVGYSQQRRYFANTAANPVGFWGSQPGLPYNFNVHAIPQDSDCIFGSLAGDELNEIEHVAELKFMLMLTSGAELFLQGNGSGVVTPSAINASVQSQYGSNSLQPIRLGDVLLFNQALGSFIRDFSFDFAIDGYRGNDITVFSSHLFEGYTIQDWTYQKVPDSTVWIVRSDGLLLGCTYVREQQILAWHRHDFTNGLVESACAIPENGEYALYLSIKRTINGSTVRYVERLASRIWTDPVKATYLDSFAVYNGINTGSTTVEITVPNALDFDSSVNAYQQLLFLTTSTNFFNSSMVGDEIIISDQDLVINTGNMVDPNDSTTQYSLSQQGEQIRFIISGYSSPTRVTGYPNRAVPTTLQNIPRSSWARAVKTITGLNYLVGEDASVWADRFVVGSPLNSDLQTIYNVPSNGTLTLDKNYAVIYVGLPMTADLETLDIETMGGETLIAKRKRQYILKMYTYNTRTFHAGSQNPDFNLDNENDDPLFQLFEWKQGIERTTYDEPPPLSTVQDFVIEDSRWNKNGRIFIRNVDPVPVTLLAIVPAGDNSSPMPGNTRV